MVMTNFGKQYKNIKKLGHEVYLVIDKENKYYAIKKIKIYDYEENVKKIFNEIEKILIYISKIINDNIIKYYESEIKDDYFYILMEYGGNSNLKQFIEEYKYRNKNIDEKIIKDILIQICHGLKDIDNNNINHRDLTPNNIFITYDNKIKIGGLEKAIIKNEPSNNHDCLVGTKEYFYPEILFMNLYSLGYIIYELFTLKEYYKDKNIKKDNKKDFKINSDIYNPKWQELIDLIFIKDYKEKPDIEGVYCMIKDY